MTQRNVLGTELIPCGQEPATGWLRDGCCRADPADPGKHLVCARMTEEFLAFSRMRGNDLSTPRPEYDFAGLLPGDRWCLCALRWLEAFEAGIPPPVLLNATHEDALQLIPLAALRYHAIDAA